MKVKIKNKIYDGNEEPVMVILSDEDKRNIKEMNKSCNKYCSFPDEGYDIDGINEWMDELEETEGG